ncbi:hypothetical protein XM38_012390 [Halomicronema hongdechloris C2206]|uniref:Uncharacterized protein n=1 Tax=Halomicronema hongdechloris C2206 TaxID=1641165 RepID=A0A1Z3HJ12_9CYAN|nr:hypothetical protein [Halomicronema hongdechloris]ASC70302.1 hypothetical protein XM38_012390 [Halomicronema hongdechloris C2206]
MMQCLTSFFHSNAVAQLETLYGSKLQKMPTPERLALIAILAEAAYMVTMDGHSEYLHVIAENNGYSFTSHPRLLQLLAQLDSELNGASDAVRLIEGIASLMPTGG